MERRHAVTVDLPTPLLLGLGRAAQAAGCSPSDYLRAVLRGALDRTPARIRSEEETVRRAVHLSSDWVDLQRNLRRAGFVLRRGADGALILHSWPVERPLIAMAAFGLGEAELTLRFGVGFPPDAAPRVPVPARSGAPARVPGGRAA